MAIPFDPRARIRSLFATHGLVDRRDFELLFEEYRAQSGETLEAYVERLVAMQPDLIVMLSTPALMPLRRRAPHIPLVFYNLGADPTRMGLVESLRRPGGNATGTTLMMDEARELQSWQFIKEVVPSVTRVGILAEKEAAERAKAEGGTMLERAKTLGIEPVVIMVPAGASKQQIADAVESARVQLVVIAMARTPAVLDYVKSSKLPTMAQTFQAVKEGVMLGMSFDFTEGEDYAVAIAARILRGENPATIPVYQSTRPVSLAINRTTARAVGVTIPPALLLRAERFFD